jgi:hypothetical protein
MVAKMKEGAWRLDQTARVFADAWLPARAHRHIVRARFHNGVNFLLLDSSGLLLWVVRPSRVYI